MRGCDQETDEVFYKWAPNLKRCPKSQLTGDALEAVGWWSEWKRMGWLPWPGGIHEQPAYVYDALMICQSADDAIAAEMDRNG